MISGLKSAIMRRVYLIWFLRRLLHSATVKTAALAAAVWQLASRVSLGDVLANVRQVEGLSGHYRFVVSALTETEHLIQVLLGVAAILGLWLGRDLLKLADLPGFSLRSRTSL